MSVHVGRVSTYPYFMLYIVSKTLNGNMKSYPFTGKWVIHLSSILLERFDCSLIMRILKSSSHLRTRVCRTFLTDIGKWTVFGTF